MALGTVRVEGRNVTLLDQVAVTDIAFELRFETDSTFSGRWIMGAESPGAITGRRGADPKLLPRTPHCSDGPGDLPPPAPVPAPTPDPAAARIITSDVGLFWDHIELTAPGSVLARVTVTDAVCDGSSRHAAAVTLAGAGSRVERSVIADSECDGVLVLAPDVQLATCAIAGHALAGVRVADGANVRIGACNLVGNHGPGVFNETDHLVDARGNWWGDPAGPDGPEGDGAAGPVDHSEPLGAPVPVEP